MASHHCREFSGNYRRGLTVARAPRGPAPVEAGRMLTPPTKSCGDVMSQEANPPSSSAAQPSKEKIQGEGDYEAARRYRDEVSDFEAKADVDSLARQAAPKSPQEERELNQAEDKGRSRSKGDDAGDAAIMSGKKSA